MDRVPQAPKPTTAPPHTHTHPNPRSIFVHAPSSNNKLVFGQSGASGDRAGPGERWALDPSDPRVRRVPFVTRRPTFSELKRVLLLLGAVMVPRMEEEVLEEEEEEEGEGGKGEGGVAAAAAAAAAAGGVAGAQPPGSVSPVGGGDSSRKKAVRLRRLVFWMTSYIDY